ncbi:tetratricopeptide repeat protein [Deferrisoma camini]|uniref:tetratricopeptide repeat protein n=1 Tax=Deferrisoma camini TaxID=1035120 RepID=UPI00046D7BBD|nr:tetratricopeptide repeat protein [Deferrisoma camini]
MTRGDWIGRFLGPPAFGGVVASPGRSKHGDKVLRCCLQAARTLGRVALIAGLVVWAWGGAFAGSREHLEVGLKAYRDGFHDLAAKELRAYLEAEPSSPDRAEILDLLFRAELARGNPEGARAALEELARLGRPEAEYWLGWLAVREGRDEEALTHLARYLKAGGDRVADARLLAARSSAALGRWKEAQAHYRAFLSAAPRDDSRRAAAWLGLVKAAREAGDPKAVETFAREALGDPALAGAREALRGLARTGAAAASTPEDRAFFWGRLAASAEDPADRAEALYEQGRALAEAGEPEAAAGALERFLALEPRGDRAVEARLVLADVARARGDLGAALTHLEGAIAAGAAGRRALDLHRAAFALASKLGDEGRAEAHARALLGAADAVSRQEADRARWFLAGRAAAAGRAEEAVGLWDAIDPAGPLGPAARLSAARTLLDRGDAGGALKRVEPLLATATDLEPWLLAVAAAEAAGDEGRAGRFSAEVAARVPADQAPGWLERAVAHFEKAGDRAQARALRERLATEHPATAEGDRAALALQVEAFRAEDWAGVLRWSAAARRADPSGAAELREAEALVRTGKNARAAEVLEAVAGRPGPHRARALLRLGTLADEAGDFDRARQRYEAALAAGLPDPAGRWVRRRLAELREAGRGR